MNIVEYTSEYEHLAKNFKCGNSVIDKFLHDGNALDKNQGITYILLSDENLVFFKIFPSLPYSVS